MINETKSEFQTVQQDLKRINENANTVYESHSQAQTEIESLKQINSSLSSEKKDLVEKHHLLEKLIGG